jgi:predicted metal-dependent HD superfamily phosphohydrolase
MLKQTFLDLVKKYSSDQGLAETLWEEIETNYSDKKRYYHTLTHLENVLYELTKVKEEIADWDTILFSLFYHDIVYKSYKGDNEQKSAELAKERLQSIGYPAEKIEKCVQQILATKDHKLSDDSDTNLFTDADLSILGQPWEVYENYTRNVRKEYSIFPDFLYNRGRKKVLCRLLDMNPLYKTRVFFEQYEVTAKDNLSRDLAPCN